jgi:hypothetical protein
MARSITHGALRNESDEITRAPGRGETFVLTSNGVPLGGLTPVRERRSVRAEKAVAVFVVRLRSTPSGSRATWTTGLTRRSLRVADPRRERGIIDMGVVMDLERFDPGSLPSSSPSVVTLAELAAGPRATADATERARSQDRLQRADAILDPSRLDRGAACAYGRVRALRGGSKISSSESAPITVVKRARLHSRCSLGYHLGAGNDSKLVKDSTSTSLPSSAER